MPGVPQAAAVTPGTRVHIVLKADQPTGRQVTGTVAEVLTRGDHPHGIKVRLADGRVGRVQKLAGPEDGGPADVAGSDGAASGGWPQGRRDGDEEALLPAEEIGLDAYIRPARPTRRGRRNGSGKDVDVDVDVDVEVDVPDGQGGAPDGVVRCPVCDTFEGDEAAVAHHVASHFDS